MVELTRTSEPPQLASFRERNPSPADFDSIEFAGAKRAIKARLNSDQGGLCAYCESLLAADEGQIDHVKPKGGRHARPDLAFAYSNFVHSCIRQTPPRCGQKKGEGMLPIEPSPGCNAQFSLSSSDGAVSPLALANKQNRHAVNQTIGMLALNEPALQRERQRWVRISAEVLRSGDSDFTEFIKDKPFRFILRKLFA